MNYRSTIASRRRSLDKKGWHKSFAEVTSGKPSLESARALYKQVKSERARRMTIYSEDIALPVDSRAMDPTASGESVELSTPQAAGPRGLQVRLLDPIVAAEVESRMQALEMLVCPCGACVGWCVARAAVHTLLDAGPVRCTVCN